jgi:hypothetical protein
MQIWDFFALCRKELNSQSDMRAYQRAGQILFNNLTVVRPDLSEVMRGTDFDPFYANGPSDERYQRAIRWIKLHW